MVREIEAFLEGFHDTDAEAFIAEEDVADTQNHDMFSVHSYVLPCFVTTLWIVGSTKSPSHQGIIEVRRDKRLKNEP
jgi:hypothetical protein